MKSFIKILLRWVLVGEDRIVLIDYGLTHDVYGSYYS